MSEIPPYLIVVGKRDTRPAFSDAQAKRIVKGLATSRYVDASDIRVYVVGNLIDITGQYVFQENE